MNPNEYFSSSFLLKNLYYFWPSSLSQFVGPENIFSISDRNTSESTLKSSFTRNWNITNIPAFFYSENNPLSHSTPLL